ncbi:MAG TPA: hypothetical protein VN690_03215 [Terriglobales bacterium]|nr:hypothetical protein [Terriglobales bacterium]
MTAGDALGRVVETQTSGASKEFVYGPTGARMAQMSGPTLVSAGVPLPSGSKAIYTSSGLAAY